MGVDPRPPQQADTDTALRLSEWLRALIGREVAEVRVSRVRWQDGPHWCVLALTVDPRPPFGHREVPLAEGGHHKEIALLLRDAFPLAGWSRDQDYDVATGTLREHVVWLPACLRGDEP